MTFLDLILSRWSCRIFPANSRFLIYFGPNFFLQLVNGGFDVRVLCVIVQQPKPMFLLDEV